MAKKRKSKNDNDSKKNKLDETFDVQKQNNRQEFKEIVDQNKSENKKNNQNRKNNKDSKSTKQQNSNKSNNKSQENYDKSEVYMTQNEFNQVKNSKSQKNFKHNENTKMKNDFNKSKNNDRTQNDNIQNKSNDNSKSKLNKAGQNNNNSKLSKANQDNNNSQNKNTNKTGKKENVEKKDLVKIKEPAKLTLIEEEQRRQKKNFFVLVSVSCIVVLLCIFSTAFALLNVTKTTIAKGVFIKGIDVSNLTTTEARNKIEEALRIELNKPISLKTNEYETSISTDQIEFEYNIADAINSAHEVGRKGNIVQNNYELLFAAFFEKNINIEYTYNSDTLNYIVDSIESKVPGLVEQATYYREDDELIVIPGKDGIIVEKDELKDDIINSIVSLKAVDLLNNNNPISLDIPVKSVTADAIDIEKIYGEVYTEPKDAYYEENPFKIYAEVEGVDFAISKEEAKNMVSTSEEEYRIPLKLTPAEKTINDIGTEAFPYLITTATTKYDASNKNRSQNLAIAAGKIDGTVLMPGEEFSFNQVVGKRTIEEGYKDAKIYQDGQVVDGLAGGICQISSTLYNAVVQANLDIVERRNHSFTTSYLPAGTDATVVYGVIDFKFKNSRTYPIKIESSINSGIAEFKIYGIKEEVEYDVKLAPVTTGSIPYSTQTIPDSTLAPGQQVVVQAGHNGCKVTTYKEKRLDGKLVSREIISTDTYSPMKTIVRVGV